MKVQDKLNAIFNKMIGNRGFQPEILHSVFIAIRRLIEQNSKENDYKTTWFYCNWQAHVRIDRSSQGYSMIRKISQIFLQNLDNEDVDYISRKISNELSLSNLHNELDVLFDVYKINKLILEPNVWDFVVQVVVDNIDAVPITLPERSELYKELEEQVKKINPDHWEKILPTSLYVSVENGKAYWNLQMKQMLVIKGALLK
jgi:hypothetical protein